MKLPSIRSSLIALTVLSLPTAWCGAAIARHDGVPPGPQKKPAAIVGATIHPVSGDAIENGTVLFEGGKITMIGPGIAVPEGTAVLNAKGMHVYPGLIESHSQLGLTEIASVAATLDFQETGSINSNAKAQVAVNPDSELIPVTRAGGVLLALTAPSGGAIAGKTAVIQLDGWTYEDMTLRAEASMVVSWPQFGGGGRRGRGRPSPNEESAAGGDPTERRIKELRDFFNNARAYLALRQSQPDQQPFDLRYEGMATVLAGQIPMLVRADRLSEIQTAVAFAAEQKVKLVILGGYDAPLCADLLKQHDVPVIVSAVYRMPIRSSDPYDYAYSLPARLQEAGVRFCISGSDRSESWNVRTLPFHAGTAVAYGLSHDAAIRALTLSSAEILGVADRVGSLEVGKDATLIVTTGSPLDIRSQIVAAFIQGRPVDLENKHTRLYKKYSERLNQLRGVEAHQ